MLIIGDIEGRDASWRPWQEATQSITREEIHEDVRAIQEIGPRTRWAAKGRGIRLEASGPRRSGEANNYLDHASLRSLIEDTFWCWCLGGKPRRQSSARSVADRAPRQPPGDLAKLQAFQRRDTRRLAVKFEGDDKACAMPGATEADVQLQRRWFQASSFTGDQTLCRGVAGAGADPRLPLAAFCSTNSGLHVDGRALTCPKQPREYGGSPAARLSTLQNCW